MLGGWVNEKCSARTGSSQLTRQTLELKLPIYNFHLSFLNILVFYNSSGGSVKCISSSVLHHLTSPDCVKGLKLVQFERSIFKMSILEQRGEILKHLIHFSNASGSRNAESSWLSARIPSRGNTCLLWTWVFIAGGTGNKIMVAFHSVQAVQSFMEQIWQHIGSCNSESYFPLTEPCIWGSCGAREPGKKVKTNSQSWWSIFSNNVAM